MNNLLVMFQSFGLGYFIYLIIAVAIVIGLIFALKRLEDKAKFVAQISMVSAMGVFLVLEYIVRCVGVNNFKLGNNLPFEIFEVSVYFCILTLFIKKNSLKRFIYLILTPISVYNMIFVPTMYTIYSSFSLCIICYYLINSLVVAFGILEMFWMNEDLDKRHIIDASITYFIIIAVAHLFNVFMQFSALGIHSNYFGTMGEGYDILINWLFGLISLPFICLIPLMAVLIGIEFLLVLPFDLIKTKKRKQDEIEELIALGNLKAQAEHRQKNKSSKSQILVRSESKASPSKPKKVNNSGGDGFVKTTKEIQVNKDTKKE